MLGFSEQGSQRFAYGFWRWREGDIDAAERILSLARDSGIDHFDTADVYGGEGGFGSAERLLGAIRKHTPSLLEGAVIATKAGCEPGSPYNSSPAYLTSACDASLKRLGVERIDLFYVHRPDFLSHPAELAATLDSLVKAGKIACAGVSNFSVAQVSALAQHLKAPIAAHQLEFSAGHIAPLYDGTLDQAMERRIAVAAWSPLARGGLGESGPANLARSRKVLEHLAGKHGSTPTAVAVAFLLKHPAPVTPILGTTKPERLQECLAAAKLNLSRADWYALVEAARGTHMP
jgi:predicted oxidoreductase